MPDIWFTLGKQLGDSMDMDELLEAINTIEQLREELHAKDRKRRTLSATVVVRHDI